MDLNEKMIADIAGQLGLSRSTVVGSETIRKLEGKSDQELMGEILKLREQLKENNISYDKQKAILQNLLPMMKGEQRSRLEKIIKMLGM